MDDSADLRQRLAQLEAQVAALEATVQQLQSSPPRQRDPEPHRIPIPSPPPALVLTPAPPPSPPFWSEWFQNWELWLNRLGIGLFLLGVAFLFRYAVDQGWVTPHILVGLGLGLGTGLLWLGWRVRQRRVYSQFLQGGGLATEYITGFAAFQVLRVVPFPVAFAFMVVVTVVAFGMALRQNRPTFAQVGLIGGLATPFLLYQASESTAGLAVYTLGLIVTSLVIYGLKGWRSFLYTSFGLGWLVLWIAVYFASGDRALIQLTLGLTGLGYAGIPVWREGRAELPPRADGEVLTLVNPLLAVLWSWALWDWVEGTAGWVFLAVGLGYLAVGWLWPRLAITWQWVYVLTGQMLVIVATLLLLGGTWEELVIAPLAMEALIMHGLAQQVQAPRMRVVAHVLWGILWWAVLWTWHWGSVSPPVFNSYSLSLLVMMAGAVGSTWFLGAGAAMLYWWSAYLGALLWMQSELGAITPGLATLSWGLFGVGLLMIGLRRDQRALRRGGMATILITIGRLVVLDFMALDPLWRVVLFLGFGAGLLWFSYAFRSLWQEKSGSRPDSSSPPSDQDVS